MAVLYNGPVQQFQFVQFQIGEFFPGPWILFIKFPGNNDNDIRFRASIFWFRDFTATPIGEAYAQGQFRAQYDRTCYRIQEAAGATDIIRVVPYYDFPQLVIQTSGDDLAG